jgi:chromosome segregation ATPase
MQGWDKKRVFGKVFELFELKDDTFTKALELGVGPKLNNVVVDDEDTATYMLKSNIV